ncbi:FixH family protein [Alteribacter aurantiacus]|uniref:FixH family protein n=1 Tax=Alteribacter aurantiacus TaxID=254410 RepID=UPI000416F39B|nr:FixH family protein [Alteribacter aurantiacus]
MKKVFFVTLMSVFIVACGGQDEEDTQSSDPLDNLGPIDVEVTMDSEGDPGDWTLEALVSQEGDPVNNADEVVFEVWKQGEKEDSDMLEYEEVNDGVYSASYTFEEEGIYFVIPHVTAHGMHVMPTHELVIGDVDPDEHYHEAEEEQGHDHEDHGHESEPGHHHHSELVEVESNFDDLERDAQIELTITEEGEGLEDARVQLEIWQHGDEVRTWVDADDEGNGNYTANHEFDEAGDYHVVIHIENDELHEHLDESFTIE